MDSPAARILVVDDEPDLEVLVTQRFRRRIRSGELDFLFARDGQHALEVLGERDDVQMVLSDINMPRMDGLTLLNRLRDEHADLRTVIVSAYGDMSNIRRAMNSGAFDFLTKPIEFQDLIVTIEKTLDAASRMRELQEQRREAERARHAMARYFSPSIARRLEGTTEGLKLGGERRYVSLVFSDMAGFTPLVESIEPESLAPLLSEYLEGLAKVIFSHEGTVLKIIGDEVRAIFGAPVDQPDHADKAIQCVLEMDRFAQAFRAEKETEGVTLGRTRFGVSSGDVMVGDFGGAGFFEYTAYGDTVNVAARLEAANKHFGTRICIAESTVEGVTDFRGRPVANVVLRGKTASLQVYEPVLPEDYGDEALADYGAAYELMRSGSTSARQAFAVYVGRFAEDTLGAFHLSRLLAGEASAEVSIEG